MTTTEIIRDIRPAETGASGVGTWRPTGLMERVSRHLESAGEPLSVRVLGNDVTGNKDHIKVATEVLVTEGYVTTENGPRNAILHTAVKPYRQADDPQSDLYRGPLGTVTPTSEPISTVRPSLSLQKGTGDGRSDRPFGDSRGTVGDGGKSDPMSATTCAGPDCSSPPRPGKVMCQMHYTFEPSGVTR